MTELAHNLEAALELVLPGRQPKRQRLTEVACPRCGTRRLLRVPAVRAIEAGKRSGECQPGTGCRAAISVEERMRRWWLVEAGVELDAIVRAGGAREYVIAHGLPPRLAAIARDLGGELELA